MAKAIKTRVFRVTPVEGHLPYVEFPTLTKAQAFIETLVNKPGIQGLIKEGNYQKVSVKVLGNMGRLDHLEIYFSLAQARAAGAKDSTCTECNGTGDWHIWRKDWRTGKAWREPAASRYGKDCFDCHGKGYIAVRHDDRIIQERPEWAKVPVMEESVPQEVVLYQADPEEDLGNGLTAADLADLPF